MKATQELENTTKAYCFSNVEEIIDVTNGDIKDIFYIGDKANGGRNYR
jgi:hypothetical protein